MFMLQHLLASGSRSSVLISVIYEIIDVNVAASTGFW